MSPKHSVLSVHGLGRDFGSFCAVKSLDLELYAGEVYGFLGHNGAGKSTTIRMLTGFLKPSRGEIRILELDPLLYPVEIRRKIGLVPDHLQMYDRLSCWEFLEFCGRMHGLSTEDWTKRASEGLQLLELWEKRDTLILDCSQGMKQKLALLSALIHKPKILFLDEPFNGMDAISVIRVRQLLMDLRDQGMTVFFSSHILEIVEKVCDRVGIIRDGELIMEGTQAEILNTTGAKSLEEVFLHGHGTKPSIP